MRANVLLPWGPSPRGRGNPTKVYKSAYNVGAIPAWAGEPAPPLMPGRT